MTDQKAQTSIVPGTRASYRFAAIDVGSNAVRLLLATVLEPQDGDPIFLKESLVRMPIRLGADTFVAQAISEAKAAQLVQFMQGFRSLMDAFGAIDYLACATSAMREASNGPELVERIREASGIDLRIILGAEEGSIIAANRIEEQLDAQKSYLYIDVGGGSTELTVRNRGGRDLSQSFDVGTVRLLHDTVQPGDWSEMKKWLRKNVRGRPTIAIGSGGNINKAIRMSRRKPGQSISLGELAELRESLLEVSLLDRIRLLKMRPDRADVIVPALQIYVSAMKWAGAKKMLVPQFGLSDGLIHLLYERHRDPLAKLTAVEFQDR